MLWYLLALAPVAAIIYIVWAYRRRTTAHAAASRERFTQIFDPSAQRSPAAVVAPVVAQVVSQGAASAVTGATRATGTYAKRTRLLSPHHARLLEILDSGLADHQVFVHVSLGAVIELTGLPEGREREQRLRAVAQHTIDCVVCSKSFEIVAAIDLENGEGAETRFKAECLKAAGVRYLRWNPLELPSRSAIGALITGA